MASTLIRRAHLGLATAAAAALTLAGLSISASPAGAAATDSDTLVFASYSGGTTTLLRNGLGTAFPSIDAAQIFEGNFSGAPGTDVFYYSPGSTPDGILHLTPSGSAVTPSFRTVGVAGTYRPLVGDFDGNAIDDIFWYAPGRASDHLWLFESNGSHTSLGGGPLTVNGSYRPAVLDVDGDSDQDIVWHGPGSAPDHLWRMDDGIPISTVLTINGNYILVPGYFGEQPEGSPQKRLIFYSATGGDSIWTFAPGGSHTSAPLPTLNGDRLPIVGRFYDPAVDSVLWYRPGTASEALWAFNADGTIDPLFESPQVHGTYSVAVGDYDGNGHEDIAFSSSAGIGSIWTFDPIGYFIQPLTPPAYSDVATAYTDYLP